MWIEDHVQREREGTYQRDFCQCTDNQAGVLDLIALLLLKLEQLHPAVDTQAVCTPWCLEVFDVLQTGAVYSARVH